MPAPSTIVTFKDADGDEFSVRVWQFYSGSPMRRAKLVTEGMQELERLDNEGGLKPSWPVTVANVESA